MRLQVDLTVEVLEPEPRDVVAERREHTMKDQFSAMIDGRPVELVLVPAGQTLAKSVIHVSLHRHEARCVGSPTRIASRATPKPISSRGTPGTHSTCRSSVSAPRAGRPLAWIQARSGEYESLPSSAGSLSTPRRSSRTSAGRRPGGRRRYGVTTSFSSSNAIDGIGPPSGNAGFTDVSNHASKSA
jgi:hypothetical protein